MWVVVQQERQEEHINKRTIPRKPARELHQQEYHTNKTGK
jgi:hypothetical protein